MATKIETLRGPRQLSPWIVIGTAAALIVALAVLTVPETAPPTREPAVTTRVTNEATDMAELKSAVAHRYMVQRFGVGEVVSSPVSEARMIWGLKVGIASTYLGTPSGLSESPPAVNEDVLEAAVKARLVHGVLETSSTGSEEGHPVRPTG